MKIIIALFVLVTFNICSGATINVPLDYPNIQAGIDAASVNDTVLVGDGVYAGPGNRDITFSGKNIVVRSENGPDYVIINCEGTSIEPHRGFNFINGEDSTAVLEGFTVCNGYGPLSHGHNEGGAVMINSSSPTIKSCLFIDNSGPYQGGAVACFFADAKFCNCTFFNNSASYGGAFYGNYTDPQFNNCLFAYNLAGAAINGELVNPLLSCCDIYHNQGGDWNWPLSSQLGQNGNISENPLFCDTLSGNFHVSSNSPCGVDANPGCGAIGAFETDCSDFMTYPISDNLSLSSLESGSILVMQTFDISWNFYDTASTMQSAYEIEIGLDQDWIQAEVWSSGQIESADENVAYSGPALLNNTKYYFRIRLSNGIVWGPWSYLSIKTHYIPWTFTIPADFAAIQEAIDSAVIYDTILVEPGTYTENIDYKGKTINIISTDGPENTFLTKAVNGQPIVTFSSGEDTLSVLEGFSIYGAQGASGVYLSGSSSATIRNNIIYDNITEWGGGIDCGPNSKIVSNIIHSNESSRKGGGILVRDYSNVLILDNIIYNNASNDGGGAICLIYGSNHIIENNVIYNNTVNDDLGGVVYAEYSDYITINNNTIVNNNSSSDKGAGIYLHGAEDCQLYNNIISGNTGGYGIYVNPDTEVSLSCNDVYGNGLGNYYGLEPGLNDIASPPMFCDQENNDFSLDVSSLCGPFVNTECGLIGAREVACEAGLPNAIKVNYGPAAIADTVFESTPEFYWTYFDTAATSQVYVEIEVGTDANWSVAEMWSSGPITNSDTSEVYAGTELDDREYYYVRLRVSDGNDWGAWSYSRFFTYIKNTLYVPSEYATIQAGIDMTRSGDTVIVADGIFSGQGNRDIEFRGKGIVVMSENGPQNTIIDCEGTELEPHQGFRFTNAEDSSSLLKGFTIKNGYCESGLYGDFGGGGAIHIEGSSPIIEECVFFDNVSGRYGGAISCTASYAKIRGCTIANNSAPYGSGIMSLGGQLVIDHCIVAYNHNGAAFLGGGVGLYCCDVYGNIGGDWVGGISGQLGYQGNISEDPLFCNLENNNLSISLQSSCSPYVNSGCGLIGALPPGCEEDLPFAVNISYGSQALTDMIYEQTPAINWVYFDTAVTVQASYQIEVGSDEDWSVAEMWNSGQIMSSDSSAVYGGLPFENNQEYYLRIRLHNGSNWGVWSYSSFATHLKRVFYVPADYPTIQAAIDQTLDGDTVAVADGIYSGIGNCDIDFAGRNIIVKSENGAENTIIDCAGSQSEPHRGFVFTNDEDSTCVLDGFTVRNGYGPVSHSRNEGGAIMIDNASPKIKGCIFSNNTGNYQGGAVSCFYSYAQFIGCTFIGNSADYGGCIYSSHSLPALDHCIIAFGTLGGSINGNAELNCCDIYGNIGGDWELGIAGQFGNNGNISDDPQFCDTSTANYRISFNSTCGQILNSDCGLIGALPTGCNENPPIALNVICGTFPGGDTVLSENPEILWTYYDSLPTTQVKYEIMVSSDNDWSIAEMWESGPVESSDTSVIYAGNTLDDDFTYYLRIRLFNGTNWGDWTYRRFYTHLNHVIWVPDNQPTIQTAIDYAIHGDTIYVRDGVYTGEGNRDMNFGGKRILVKSENGPESTIIDCQGSTEEIHRAFTFENYEDSTSVLDGFTIQNGYIEGYVSGDAGAILCKHSSPIIRNCVFEDNFCQTHGGAFYIIEGSLAEITDCKFLNNESEGWGGAVAVDGSSPVFNGCQFISNLSETSGGLHFNRFGSPQVINCLFTHNIAYYDAGAIGAFNGGNLQISSCTIVDNTANEDGSGLYTPNAGSTIEACIFAYNSGGLVIYGNPDITCTDLYGNESGDWVGNISYQFGLDGNISANPLFCDFENDNYNILIGSPCSPYINTECGLIGTFGADCGEELPYASIIVCGSETSDGFVFDQNPAINWVYFDTASTVQAAFEIEIGSDEDWSVAEMWNSGQIISTDTSIVYAGSTLNNNREYYLRLRLYNGSVWGSWLYSSFVTHFGSAINVPSDWSTIQSGIDHSLDGDTVFIADGIYNGDGNRDIDFEGKRITVKSVNGAEFTIVDCEGSSSDPHRGFIFVSGEDSTSILENITIRNGYGPYSHNHYEGGAVMIDYASPLIKGCVFIDNIGEYQGGAISCFGSFARIINCTFSGNSSNHGAGIYSKDSYPAVENCIISFSPEGASIYGDANLKCCNLFGNAGGDWLANISSQLGINGNMSEDPLYCDTSSGNYRINYISACSPVNNSECGLIGALAPGCVDNPPLVLNLNYGTYPYGDTVFTTTPAIYWDYFDTAATTQVKYEIEVSSDDDWTDAEMWASGAVESSETSAVYSGLELSNETLYYLRIRLNNGVDWGAWNNKELFVHLRNIIQVPADKPTIQAAIDYAVNGDTIVIANGTYTGDGNRDINFDGKRIVVRSENGPEYTIIDCEASYSSAHRGFNFISGEDSTSILEGISIINGYGPYTTGKNEGGAIKCQNSSPKISNCIFANCIGDDRGGAITCLYSYPQIFNCTFAGNAAVSGSSIYSYNSTPMLRNCIIAFGKVSGAVSGNADFSCSDIYGNEGGDWIGEIEDQLGQNGNISENPLFCDTAGLDLRISFSSPCNAENNECNLVIGAGSAGVCNPHAILLFDRSGSMFYENPLGFSRLERAKQIAHEELSKLLDPNDVLWPEEHVVAIMYFNSNGIILLQDFTMDSTQLHNAIDAVPDPRHDTPLAAAMCQAVCNIYDAGGNSGVLITYTDGRENESQNFEICTICESCNQYMETGWNYDCRLFGIPTNCTEWQICVGYSLVSKAKNYAHYFGELLDPYSKDASGQLEDFQFLRFAAEESGGQFFYHSDLFTICGDASSDGLVNISDVVFIINFVFLGGEAPHYSNAADVNCDSMVNVSDAVYLINYIFTDGKPPCDINNNGESNCQ